MPRLTTDQSSDAGFSLVEVLCALAICATSLIALYRGLGGSQTAAAYLDAHLGARVIAQSILEDERQAAQTAAGTRNGVSGRYEWRLSVTPEQSPETNGLPAAFHVYRLAVSVSWEPRGRFDLDTLKLGK